MGQKGHISPFANPDDDRKARKAWQTLGHTDIESGAVRNTVASSWSRCLDACVDPNLTRAPDPLRGSDLAELQSLNAEIIEASEQTIKIATELLSEAGAAMMLTDRNGTILKIQGDPSTLDVLETLNMLPGASWKEVNCGTNAIGTALASGHSIQIHASEHFCEPIKRFTCSASTIIDPCTGDIVGAINVSGFANTYSQQTLSLVVTAAQRVKEALELSILRNRYRLLDYCATKFSSSEWSRAAIFDRRGFAVRIGDIAERALISFGIGPNQLNLANLSRVGEGNFSTPGQLKETADAWFSEESVEPISDCGDRIGSIIRFPLRNSSPRRNIAREPDRASMQAFVGAKGESWVFQQAVGKACRIAKSDVPVLLLGETGVGKEIFANGIHHAAGNTSRPFIALNCGALNKDLLASELFGYVDGAFTGARRGGMRGKIEAANGGTLFLDEIGEMPLDIQPTFLRVLEEREVLRIGESQPKQVSFRLICATNRDLRKEVAEGRFRMDLYYRISVVPISIPSLRERNGDAPILAEYFVETLCKRHNLEPVTFSREAIAFLNSYEWPGNIRELRNIVESLILSADSSVISMAQLEAELLMGIERHDEPDTALVVGGLARGEFEQIRKALQQTGGNATKAAKELGIAKSTLYLKIRKLGLSSFLDSQRSPTKP